MPTLEPLFHHVLPLLLVVTRFTGLFVFTPLLRSATVPRMFKVFLAFTFGIAIYQFVPEIPKGTSSRRLNMVSRPLMIR